jgi:RNA polymerase sporulation-specific sigma factor
MDEVRELIKRAQAGDKSASDTLVEQNMGLIWSVVKKFIGRGYEPDDLFQLGAIGLIKCINKFDLSYDVKFSTYAVPMIVGEIKRFLRDDGLIKVSRPLKEIAKKAKYMEESIIQKTGQQPTVSELAAAVEIEAEDLILALEAGKEVESLTATIYQGDGSPIYLIDKLTKNNNNENTIVDMLTLRETINKLKPKEKEIIMLRYFSEKTQTEIAAQVGVSQVQVSRIEKKVLEGIRKQLTVD